MNYFFRYDVEINKLDGVNIELMQGSFMQNYIEIDKRISDNGQVYIDFALPKSKAFRSIALNKDEKTGNYLLHIPSRVVQDVGNVSFQVVVYVDNQIIKTNVLEHISVLPSINAVEEITQEDLKLIDQVLTNDFLQNEKIEQNNAKIADYSYELQSINAQLGAQNNKLETHNDSIENILAFQSSITDNIGNHTQRLSSCEAKQTLQANNLAQTNKGLTDLENKVLSTKHELVLVYDCSNPNLNYGAANGIKHRTQISVDVSKYKMLYVNFQYDRNMLMLMDMTQINPLNNLYINSNVGFYETATKFGFLGFEVVVNEAKSIIRANNIVRGSLANAEMTANLDARITKVYGVLI